MPKRKPDPFATEMETFQITSMTHLKTGLSTIETFILTTLLPHDIPDYPTPDEDPILDCDLSHSEFVDMIYSLKNLKSPGFDIILNEDITSTILEESEDDPVPPSQRIDLLKAFFKILSEYWFNECVPRDFKRTLLRPFLKKSNAVSSEPKNYRPISLLNTLMKLY